MFLMSLKKPFPSSYLKSIRKKANLKEGSRPKTRKNSMEATRKRARDHEAETLQAKRQECPNPAVYNDEENRYEFYDGIAVFDFPWLKEGVIFSSETSFEDHQESFGPCSYLDEAGADFGQSCSLQNLSAIGNSNSQESKNDGVDSFWSLLVDDHEPVDCIWSCVIDQPLDLGFNKG